MPKVDIIAGARPNFVKIAPIVRALTERSKSDSTWKQRLVHTGQHYDRAMSGDMFTQLGIPDPDINLGIGPGTVAEQTGRIMAGYEVVLSDSKSDLCLVVGDVTSTMACAIVARKLGVPVAHVEGGLRSRDWSMPEEINRVVTDSISNWFFTTTESASNNLRNEGVGEHRIYRVGNTMIDTLIQQAPYLCPPSFWDALSLAPRSYVVATLHRPGNVDDEGKLRSMIDAIEKGANGIPVIFPLHPRTAQKLRRPRHSSIHFVEPLAYREFNYLVKHAIAVITDSGGVTEETTFLGVPCLTMRENTERPETVELGTNKLIGSDFAILTLELAAAVRGDWKTGRVPDMWDGHAAERIVDHLSLLLQPG